MKQFLLEFFVFRTDHFHKSYEDQLFNHFRPFLVVKMKFLIFFPVITIAIPGLCSSWCIMFPNDVLAENRLPKWVFIPFVKMKIKSPMKTASKSKVTLGLQKWAKLGVTVIFSLQKSVPLCLLLLHKRYEDPLQSFEIKTLTFKTLTIKTFTVPNKTRTYKVGTPVIHYGIKKLRTPTFF